MYPYYWSWSYTILAALLLLALFLLIGAVLLLRSSPLRRWHRSQGRRISTPYGDIGYEDIETQHMLAQGIERARTRQYYNPRGER